ncbi:MAG: LysE family transporter [Deltaproteobacteria bacterium]|nr:LysE family transporter [Deltaproteobacteria bacterium]
MLELATIFSGSFALALSGALMPGPLLTVTVSESARIGLRAGPLLITGHAILELLLVVALVLGLGPVLKDSLVMGIVALVGGGMLVWMGIDMIRNSTKASLNNAEGAKESKKGPHPVFVGLLAGNGRTGVPCDVHEIWSCRHSRLFCRAPHCGLCMVCADCSWHQ